MTRVLTAALLFATLATACGSSSSSSDGGATTTTAVLEVAGPKPSESAKMVCEDEARGDIAATIGIDVATVSTPTWRKAEHVLSCSYQYPGGSHVTLSVKELSSPGETTAYFNSLGTRLGRGESYDAGQGAFVTKNGSMVVRKDYKVLLIDVSGLPAQFGKPPTSRAFVASNIATVIMSCWTGA